MKQPKKIPYGLTNYHSIRTENYAYVDKTRFIEQIENEPTKYFFLIRPRKFGKSLFLSTLRHYYDICHAGNFDELFGDLYIGKNPTSKRNAFFIMKFSFSGLDTTSPECFKIGFTEAIRSSISFFLVEHISIFENYEELRKELWTLNSVRGYIEFAFEIIKKFNRKAYIVIDEYDHFANDLIAQGTNLSIGQYRQLIWANGVVRDFYETLKDNSEAAIEKIFITGITPIMLDDVTSGFNISDNLSIEERYNEILGFTEDEVEFFRQEVGIDKSAIKVDMKYLYNGYKFHVDGKNRLYNSSMINYVFLQVTRNREKIKYLMDFNLKTDYGRIKMLLNKPENIENLEDLIKFGNVREDVMPRFSIDRIHEKQNFRSLLYYLGLVTIDRDEKSGKALLRIPNYTIKTMYWEYMENIIMERNPKMTYGVSGTYDSLATMAIDGDYRPFFDNFHQNFIARISNRDLRRFSEMNVKFLLLSIFFQNNIYLPISEAENQAGYADIYLQRRSGLYPKIVSDWVVELKYIRQADADDEKLFEAKKTEAYEQLQRYKSSAFFKDRTDVRYLAVVYTGKKGYFIDEI